MFIITSIGIVTTKLELYATVSGFINKTFPFKVFIIQSLQSQNVMKLTSDLWMEQQLMRVEWRYVTVGFGVQYVIMTGGLQIH